jgi:ABC-2 type transport system permease protein
MTTTVSNIEPQQMPRTEQLPDRQSSGIRLIRETALLVARSLRTIRRVPERLSDVTIQPVVFTFLFLYVFGSAIKIPGIRYQDYLLPGLIAQSIAFSFIGSSTTTATDFSSGVIDRFKSLPITRLAIISAQVIGQLFEQLLGVLIVAGIGLALGWRPHLGIISSFELLGIILLGYIAFISFGVLFGMLVRSADAVQGIAFAIVLPLSFLAGTFVPISGLARIPRVIAEYDPLSAVVAAIRQITQGTHVSGSWPLEHPIPATLLYCGLIISVCVPLTVRRFKTQS